MMLLLNPTLCFAYVLVIVKVKSGVIRQRVIEDPNERYQIATSAFHCIHSGSLNEAACNTYSAGVMEIRIAGCSCRRPQLLFDNFFFLTLDRTLGFLSLRRQPVDLFSKIFYSCNQTNNPLDHSQSPNCL